MEIARIPISPATIEKGRKLSLDGLDSPGFAFDRVLERSIRWKCDFKLLPPLIGLFLITFIDRTNIANAKIEGMATELHMGDTGYNEALWILNIPYIVLGVPSNMLMKKNFVAPSTYLSGLMFCLGGYICPLFTTDAANACDSYMHNRVGSYEDTEWRFGL
jgi:hypothetical protein